MKRAFIFSMDAFLAIVLFVLVIFLIYTFSISLSGLNQQYFFSDDLLTTLSEIKINELDLNSYPRINQLIIDGKIKDTDIKLVEQMVILESRGDHTSASMITEDIINKINQNMNAAVYVGDIKLYGNDPGNVTNIITRARLAVGRR